MMLLMCGFIDDGVLLFACFLAGYNYVGNQYIILNISYHRPKKFGRPR
jgi:hypothetical protein